MVNEFKNFISNDICDTLIEEGLKHFTPSTVLGEPIEGYRFAMDCFLDNDIPIVHRIRDALAYYIEVPIENMESMSIIKYEVGGEYKEHYDFFHESEDYYLEEINRGGQRILTLLVYLNDDFEGGETEFPNLGIKIKPKKGKLIIWNNTNDDGTVDYDSLHAGLPVKSGVKYIAVIWVRASTFF